MPPRLTKNWSETQTNECIRQFNLFKLSQGKQGWDPEKHSKPEYIKKQFQRNQTVKPYLQKSLGGSEANIFAVTNEHQVSGGWCWQGVAFVGVRLSLGLASTCTECHDDGSSLIFSSCVVFTVKISAKYLLRTISTAFPVIHHKSNCFTA
jgi:hypothetical protein